ncbi:MAG: protein-glutamate O-methyltransferase CheR [Chloroflexota bacterium]|nr:protein-glutamate O-methyltransferase CheR [Chloroflexota bacterium]
MNGYVSNIVEKRAMNTGLPVMTRKNVEDDFLILLNKVRRERGFDGFQYKASFLQRRFAARMRATKADSYREYSRVLDKDPDEYDRLLAALTINLTYFFRDKTVFQTLRNSVLNPLIREKRRRGRRMMRVWSAGCASGEEPYSVAILFHELLGDEIKDWQIRIQGTDLDAESLAKAKRGVYRDFSFRGVDRDYVKRYFIKNHGYEIRPEIKDMVRFERHDLLSDAPPHRLDLILCRNVLIYFTAEQHDRVFATFHRALSEGGHVVLGKAETLVGNGSELFQPVDLREHIYVKPVVSRRYFCDELRSDK